MASQYKKHNVEVKSAKRGRHGVSNADKFVNSDAKTSKRSSGVGRHGIDKGKSLNPSTSFAGNHSSDNSKKIQSDFSRPAHISANSNSPRSHSSQPTSVGYTTNYSSNGVYAATNSSQRNQNLRTAIPPIVPSSSKSRPTYSSPMIPMVPRKRKSRIKKIVIILISVLLALILALAAAGGMYVSMLNNTLSLDETSKAAVDEVTTPVNLNDPFYLLVLGSDSREGSGTSSKSFESGDNQRSDAIMLFRVDASSKLVTMVSIPRDTPYTHQDGTVTKINETYNTGGAAYTIKAVSEITNVPISYYAEVHFSELAAIVDTLGGVEVNVDIQLSYIDALTGEKVTIEPGVQTLNGQEAQIFARARKEYSSDQDMHRQENIRQLATAIIKSVLDRPLVELPGIILDLAGYVGTNLQTQDIVSIGMIFSSSNDTMKMYTCTGPSDGAIRPDVANQWLCYDNPQGWQILMDTVDKGEDPSGLDVNQYAIK